MSNMCTLYIEFRDGTYKTVHNVDDFGIMRHEKGYFYYIKNERKAFIPIDVVKFFGDERDFN